MAALAPRPSPTWRSMNGTATLKRSGNFTCRVASKDIPAGNGMGLPEARAWRDVTQGGREWQPLGPANSPRPSPSVEPDVLEVGRLIVDAARGRGDPVGVLAGLHH